MTAPDEEKSESTYSDYYLKAFLPTVNKSILCIINFVFIISLLDHV